MSRKRTYGSGKPSDRRQSEPQGGMGAAGPDAGVSRKPWSFAAGIVLAALALFDAQATLRAIFIEVHRDDYLRDELVAETLNRKGGLMFGQIASTGEEVRVETSILGLDLARQMQREGRLKGHRFPVWYLPHAASRTWWGIDRSRIQVLQEDSFGDWRIAVAINVALALGGIVLIRRGLKQVARIGRSGPTGAARAVRS